MTMTGVSDRQRQVDSAPYLNLALNVPGQAGPSAAPGGLGQVRNREAGHADFPWHHTALVGAAWHHMAPRGAGSVPRGAILRLRSPVNAHGVTLAQIALSVFSQVRAFVMERLPRLAP